jgi:hypothetical protein
MVNIAAFRRLARASVSNDALDTPPSYRSVVVPAHTGSTHTRR